MTPESLAERPALAILRPWLLDPSLYCVNRHSIAGAFAVGLALMWLPLPVQTLLASAFAIQLRVNLPLSASLVWITNPLTIPPMYYGAYQVGAQLTGYNNLAEFSWAELLTRADLLWIPLTTGCAALALVCAVIGYTATHVIWRMHTLHKLALRRARSRHSGRAAIQRAS